MIRFGFNIKTRTGQRVENISIMAGSQRDAERRLAPDVPPLRNPRVQRADRAAHGVDTLDVEGVIGLISGSERSPQRPTTRRGVHPSTPENRHPLARRSAPGSRARRGCRARAGTRRAPTAGLSASFTLSRIRVAQISSARSDFAIRSSTSALILRRTS